MERKMEILGAGVVAAVVIACGDAAMNGAGGMLNDAGEMMSDAGQMMDGRGYRSRATTDFVGPAVHEHQLEVHHVARLVASAGRSSKRSLAEQAWLHAVRILLAFGP